MTHTVATLSEADATALDNDEAPSQSQQGEDANTKLSTALMTGAQTLAAKRQSKEHRPVAHFSVWVVA